MIKTSKTGYFTELGKRSNNEDAFGFHEGLTYIVCDGVGGAEKGEIASEMTVQCFLEAFRNNINADVNIVVEEAENRLTDYLSNHPDAYGMATTMAFIQVRENGIFVVWCGDSRVYQFRNEEIVFKTTDHSWINEALRAGIITPQESIDHPKSNIITKAIQGIHKTVSVDSVLLNDIRVGDFFLLCSDGVTEVWRDEDLSALFLTEKDNDIILDIIRKECHLKSNDNSTAVLFRVTGVGLPIISKDVNGNNV